jgi:hypothetical protein
MQIDDAIVQRMPNLLVESIYKRSLSVPRYIWIVSIMLVLTRNIVKRDAIMHVAGIMISKKIDFSFHSKVEVMPKIM